MAEMIERVQKAVMSHVNAICEDVESHHCFSSPQQLDDLKDCMEILIDSRNLHSQSLKM